MQAIPRIRRSGAVDVNDRALIGSGTVGAIVAAICCATPLLAVLLPLVGLGAWLTHAGFLLLPLLAAGLGLITWGLHHRRARATCWETEIQKKGVKP